jgi:hypothetical protein
VLAVAPAQPKPGSIEKQDIVFAILVDLETANAIETHDGQTVISAESRLIQLVIKIRHAAAQEVRLCPDMQTGLVIRRLDKTGTLQRRAPSRGAH